MKSGGWSNLTLGSLCFSAMGEKARSCLDVYNSSSSRRPFVFHGHTCVTVNTTGCRFDLGKNMALSFVTQHVIFRIGQKVENGMS